MSAITLPAWLSNLITQKDSKEKTVPDYTSDEDINRGLIQYQFNTFMEHIVSTFGDNLVNIKYNIHDDQELEILIFYKCDTKEALKLRRKTYEVLERKCFESITYINLIKSDNE
ncbi:MAG: hypothetical protein NE334_12520 [Lentisphaeraceae bacterium]|nr:hypothetical protein [Lentisphaeraceae bacterium]